MGWETPNILNVVVPRGKYRVAIIGDNDLWEKFVILILHLKLYVKVRSIILMAIFIGAILVCNTIQILVNILRVPKKADKLTDDHKINKL
jgi:hypothetical protein